MAATKKRSKKEIDPKAARRTLFASGCIGDWILDEGQQEIRQLTRTLPPAIRKPILLISRQWGKTFLCCVLAIEYAIQHPNTLQLYVSPSIKQAANLVVPKFKQILQWAPKGLVKPVKSEYKWEFANGSVIMLGGMDTATESFRGMSVHQIWADEVGSCHPDEFDYVIQSVLIPTLTRTLGRLCMISTPSRHVSHPFHTKYIPEAMINGALYKRTIYDLPDDLCRDGVTKDAVIQFALQESGGADSVSFKREYLCEITRDDSILICPEFSTGTCVTSGYNKPEYYNEWTCGDYGGTRDKSVFLKCYWDFAKAKMVVEAELAFEAGTSNGVIAPALKQLAGKSQIWCDMPGQTAVDLRRDYGLEVTLPTKTEADAALNAVRIALGRGQILINANCKLLIASLEGGSWNDKRTDYLRTEALGHCDAIDALIYAWRMRNEKNPFPTVRDLNVWHGSKQTNVDNKSLVELARALNRR